MRTPLSIINTEGASLANYHTTYKNPLSTQNSQNYFGDIEQDDYAHVKKIRFLKHRVLNLEGKVLELKKELAMRETVFDSVKKELRDYQKIVQGLENIDPCALTLELENQRLRLTL